MHNGDPDYTRAILWRWRCDCGTDVSARQWVVLDTIARPDLADALLDGSALLPQCPSCAATNDRGSPVALARLSEAMPLILFYKGESPGDFGEDVLAALEAVYESLRTELGSFPRMSAPWESLPVFLARNIDGDLQDLPALSPLAVDPPHQTYLNVLASLPELMAREHRHELVGQIVGLHDPSEVLAFVEANPELLDDVTFDLLNERIAESPERATFFSIQRELLISIRDRGVADIDTRDRAVGDLLRERYYQPIDALRGRVQAAFDAGDWESAASLSEEALELARASLWPEPIAEFAYNTATALFRTRWVDPARFERARELLEEVLRIEGALEAHPSVAVNLASLYGQRSVGDPAENHERAVELLELAIERTSPSERGEDWAMAHTNLALVYHDRASDDRQRDLQLAAHHCNEALRFRSPDRDIDDWAYTMLNLGVVLSDAAEHAGRSTRKATEPYRSVIAYGDQITERVLVGLARTNMAKTLLHRSSRTRWRGAHRVRQAVKLLEMALPDLAEDPALTAKAHEDLSRIARQAGDLDRAEDHLVTALQFLEPDMAPEACQRLASAAAVLAVGRQAWTEAAHRYEKAAAALDRLYITRSSAAGREAALRDAVNLSRWASYAIGRTGNALRAMEVLEAGKARALGTRITYDQADLALLTDVAPDKATTYTAALAAARASTEGPNLTIALRHLDDVVRDVRRVPGLESFLSRSALDDIAQAASRQWPLVFINPTPWGTALLMTQGQSDHAGRLIVESRLLDLTSTRLFEWLSVGDGAPRSSYWFAMTGDAVDEDAAITSGLDFVGEQIMREVAELLENRPMQGATVLASGPLAMQPLHAAPWAIGLKKHCLADNYAIRFAPSAHAAAMSQRRWHARESALPRLLALAYADPDSPLPGSHAEIDAVAELFPSGSSTVRHGDEATLEALRRDLLEATHLHFACHASGHPADFRASILELADGPLTIDRLMASGSVDTLVSVASACQTAIVDLLEVAEEGYSLGNALLAAGSASAVASCWPVDDYATALVMTRFYEILLEAGRPSPSQALRTAQLWLRDLTEGDEQAFLARHPVLAAELTRRQGVGDPPGRRGSGGGGHANRPFASPYYWSSFVALGV